MTRIALDAMGGDKAPGEIVRGGISAATGMEDVKIFLVGRKEQIEAEFLKFDPSLMSKTKALMPPFSATSRYSLILSTLLPLTYSALTISGI